MSHDPLIKVRHRIRLAREAEERDDCAQGKHHEIHRGGIPRLACYSAAERISAISLHWARWNARKRKKASSRPMKNKSAALKGGAVLIKDAIADIALQQVFDATGRLRGHRHAHLNGDYLSDALAAQVGGSASHLAATSIMSPAMPFLKPHTAPLQNMRNSGQSQPGSVVLSGEDDVFVTWVGPSGDLIIKG